MFLLQVGLDHLENLVRLMEELSSLREQNMKLQRKVQDMEIEKVSREVTISMTVLSQVVGLILIVAAVSESLQFKAGLWAVVVAQQ